MTALDYLNDSNPREAFYEYLAECLVLEEAVDIMNLDFYYSELIRLIQE